MKQFLNFINGEFVATGKTFEDRAPINNQVIGLVHEAGQAEVDAAVRAARAALQGEWGKMSVVKRVELLYAVADEINRRFDDFLDAELADTGKPRSLASHIDIPRGAANFKVFADIIKNAPTESFQMTTPDGGTAISYAVRSPLGVVGVVCPWNLPLLLMTWKVGPALACGNAVIVKPSEETPATATLLGEVMNTVGIPKGVYNVVHGFGPNSAGEFLTRHPGVDGITFTGETRTGEAIMAAAAKGVRPVSFELGGKNAAVVFADADFDKTLAGLTRSVFENCGQVCLGTERVYVQRPLFDKLVAALKDKAESLKIGPSNEPGVGLGPLISAEHKEKVLGYYAKAKAEGATVVTGGGEPSMSGDLASGHFVQPTIWTGLPQSSAIIREEIFGPCCHIAPFDTEEEAIALANDTPYGLCTSIWTQDLSRAHRVAGAIHVGLCWVNSWFLRDLRTAFGGSKASGIGREGGVHSLEFYTDLRNVMIKL
jgi:aminomuconate-semialdehyde/2-hydroxymuconate-6-semialdehyde dehydrogenase